MHMALVQCSRQQVLLCRPGPRHQRKSLQCKVSQLQGSVVTPSEQRGVVDAARLHLKAAIKAAWSREAVARGVAAAKKADYALAHRQATACACGWGCAGLPRSSWLTTKWGSTKLISRGLVYPLLESGGCSFVSPLAYAISYKSSWL